MPRLTNEALNRLEQALRERPASLPGRASDGDPDRPRHRSAIVLLDGEGSLGQFSSERGEAACPEDPGREVFPPSLRLPDPAASPRRSWRAVRQAGIVLLGAVAAFLLAVGAFRGASAVRVASGRFVLARSSIAAPAVSRPEPAGAAFSDSTEPQYAPQQVELRPAAAGLPGANPGSTPLAVPKPIADTASPLGPAPQASAPERSTSTTAASPSRENAESTEVVPVAASGSILARVPEAPPGAAAIPAASAGQTASPKSQPPPSAPLSPDVLPSPAAVALLEPKLAEPSAARDVLSASREPVSRPPVTEREAPGEGRALREILGRYETAFSQRNARIAKLVWPSLDERKLEKAFDQLDYQELVFEACQVETAGAQASASCRGRVRYVPKVGSRAERTEQRTWTFRMLNTANGWTIAGVQTR